MYEINVTENRHLWFKFLPLNYRSLYARVASFYFVIMQYKVKSCECQFYPFKIKSIA